MAKLNGEFNKKISTFATGTNDLDISATSSETFPERTSHVRCRFVEKTR